MADKPEIEAEASAEKAYAAAAQAVSAKPELGAKSEPITKSAPVAKSEPAAKPAAATAPAEVKFPSKSKRGPSPKPAVAESAPVAPAPQPEAKLAKPKSGDRIKVKSKSKTAYKIKPAKAKPVVAAQPVAKPSPAIKPSPAVKPARVLKPSPAIKPAPVLEPSMLKRSQAKPAATNPITTAKTIFQQLKDKTMETTDFTTKIKGAVTEVQEKAKEAFDKGAAAFSDYNEFSKGNFEAVVESGKILASGVQSLGTALVADTKSNFETLTAEVKELVAVKSPADFFQLQAAFARRNFDLAVAQASKNSEAMLKLANDVAAPISSRVSLAVEKVKQAA